MSGKQPKPLTPRERARLQAERKQRIKQAKQNSRNSKPQTSDNKYKVVEPKKNQPANSHSATPKKQKKSKKRDEKVFVPRPVEQKSNNSNFYTDETVKRRKKAEKKQKEKHARQHKILTPAQRKRRHILAYCAIFTTILVIGITLSLTVLFKTEKIEVSGDTLYDKDTIISLTGVQKEENIFVSKFTATPQEVEKNLPYVKECNVSFKIPDTVIINVVDATPSYMIISNDKYYKISDTGRILEETSDNSDNLPIIKGSDLKADGVGEYASFADDNVVRILAEVTDAIDENGYTNINYIDVNDTGNINIIYDNRVKIVIGLPEDISYKLRTAMTIINDKLDSGDNNTTQGTLDVSKCNETKKSYFQDGTLNPATTPETQPTTQVSTDALSQSSNTTSSGTDSYSWQSSSNGGYSSSASSQTNDLGYDYYDADGYGHYY